MCGSKFSEYESDSEAVGWYSHCQKVRIRIERTQCFALQDDVQCGANGIYERIMVWNRKISELWSYSQFARLIFGIRAVISDAVFVE